MLVSPCGGSGHRMGLTTAFDAMGYSTRAGPECRLARNVRCAAVGAVWPFARRGWNDLRQLGAFDGPTLCVLQPRKTAKRTRIGTGVRRRHLTPKQEADMAPPPPHAPIIVWGVGLLGHRPAT